MTKPISATNVARTKHLPLNQLVEVVLAGSRTILERAITSIDSNARHHLDKAQQVLEQILPYSGGAIRVGG